MNNQIKFQKIIKFIENVSYIVNLNNKFNNKFVSSSNNTKKCGITQIYNFT